MSAPAPVVVSCADGYPLHGRRFVSAGASRRGATVIVATALFVPQQFYFRFASHLSERGYDVLTFDDRGSGESLAAETRRWRHRLRDWAELDLPAAVSFAHEARPEDRLYVVGHSMGGQLVGLCPHVHCLDGIVTVSASAAYWGHWGSPERYGILAWYGAVPLLTFPFRAVPAARLGLGTDVASSVVRDWAAWGRDRGYFLGPGFGMRSEMERYEGRVLVYSFADDRYLGCRKPIDELHRHYLRAEVTHRHLLPEEVGASRVGHFGYFRPGPGPRLWRQTMEWIEGRPSGAATAQGEDEGEEG